MENENGKSILGGIRVIEFAQAMAIPFCGLLMADLGAEVVKVEPPEGDAFRANQSQVLPGESKGFTIYNRGKRSVCIDLARPESAEAIDALVRWADIALVSFKPSDVERFNVGYDHFASLNPNIIYLEHVPLGPRGPYGRDGGYDVIVQGMSGLGTITGRVVGDAPQNVRPAYVDVSTGYASLAAVLAALYQRERTGEGQRVQTSLLGTGLTLAGNMLHWFAATDPDVWESFTARLGELRASGAGFEEQRQLYERTILAGGYGNIYFRHYRTRDGFVSVGCLSPVLNARLRQAIGVEDPRMTPGFELGTPEAYDALTALIRQAEDVFRGRTTAEWITHLKANGVPCGPFNFPTEVFEDPQVLANDFIIEMEHPLLGPYKTFATPFRFDRTPARAERSSPLLDADTDAVLLEAGLPGSAVERLRSSAVIGARGVDMQ
ncbi:MAG: CoA transferase [Dehalococcoidia bacterium]|nr:CoA transferase [Dehalococcoidia bacterium]